LQTGPTTDNEINRRYRDGCIFDLYGHSSALQFCKPSSGVSYDVPAGGKLGGLYTAIFSKCNWKDKTFPSNCYGSLPIRHCLLLRGLLCFRRFPKRILSLNCTNLSETLLGCVSNSRCKFEQPLIKSGLFITFLVAPKALNELRRLLLITTGICGKSLP